MDTNSFIYSPQLLQTKQFFITFYRDWSLKLFGAGIILFIGIFIARWIGNIVQRNLEKKDMEPPVRRLILRVVKLIVIVLTLVIALDKVGVPVTPLIAGLSVAGVGVGLATQGVLSNLVAGLTILFTKPFRVGEYLEVLGVTGQVKDIELFSTTLIHADLSRVIIPNRKIVGEILHNYGMMRQLDIVVGVGYNTDIQQMFALIRDVLAKNSRVLKNPGAAVGIKHLSDSSIEVAIRPWVSLTDYGAAQGEIYQAILEGFKASKIEIPFPQREVRMLNA